MAMFFIIILPYFCCITVCGITRENLSVSLLCPFYKNGATLDVKELVGNWITVYTQPKAVHCFTLQIRATTDLEREQCSIKYGNFSGYVDWSACLLEVLSPLGKHYLQSKGNYSGLLQNVIVSEIQGGQYELEERTLDQWMMFGRRGSELLLMRDCSGEAAALFVRAPYWPTATEMYAVLHRSGITTFAQQRVLCQPKAQSLQLHSISSYFSNRKF